MTMFVCAVRDRALDAFLRPFFVPSVGSAIRGFQDELNREGSEIGKHPDDYDLFVLGEWDERTGGFSLHPVPSQAAIGKQLIQAR